jgi:MYXO-CTERM domain-containing protein
MLPSIGQVIVVNDWDGDGDSDGPRQLLPDTPGQQIEIYVTGGAPVEGLNFNVQVADGFPDSGPGFPGLIDGPNITAVNITGPGTVFSASNQGMSTIRNDEQVWSVSTTTIAPATVNAAGLLGIVTVSTVGWFSGTWDFALQSTQEGATDFAGIGATITDGSITVVPEPSSQLAVALLLLGGAWFWRRRRHRLSS